MANLLSSPALKLSSKFGKQLDTVAIVIRIELTE